MKKVLVIDDQDSLRNMLVRMLKSNDFEARSAENGSEGMAICRDWAPDVILTDVFMPEQDGLETIRAVRKLRKDIGIIAMSGGGEMGEFEMLRTARMMGATRILTKPFTMAELMNALDEVLTETAAATPDEKREPPDEGSE